MNAGRCSSTGRSVAVAMPGRYLKGGQKLIRGWEGDVQISLGVPNFGPWAGPDLRPLLDRASSADAAGVDRLVVSDHVLLGRNTDAYRWGRFPTPPEGRWLEPLTCLTAFAPFPTPARRPTALL